jgi:leucyl/phenylalanyl-tRNA---protein transferase
MRQANHQTFDFPPLDQAGPEGLLAIGGDLSPDRLIQAYCRGIFPWFNPGQPILWWSPDPRAVLYPAEFRITRSLAKLLRQKRFRITMDSAFDDVIYACATTKRGQGEGSWITDGMMEAYQKLHALGFAHSVEVWQDTQLVGGLYGVVMSRVFFGESMFSRVSNSSKCAMAGLVGFMQYNQMDIIDCQVASDHLFSLGARNIPRQKFVEIMDDGFATPFDRRTWVFDDTFLDTVR